LQEALPPLAPPVREQPEQPVWLRQALPFRLQVLAQEPQASVAQPQALPVQQPGAYAPPSPPRPSHLFPLWPLLLPLLPRPLLPGDVCALSPQRPREWSSSASSFP